LADQEDRHEQNSFRCGKIAIAHAGMVDKDAFENEE
jgi:hypothetical protein